MKQLFLLCAAFGLFQSAGAQEGGAYLKIGINFANVSVTNEGEVDDARMLTSFQVGFMGDLPIGKFFAVQPAFMFTGKGSRLESGDPAGPTYYKATTNPYYIEVPVNGVFKIPSEDGKSAFFVGAGPYIAMGIAGKQKIEGKVLGASFNNKENITFSNDDPTTLNYEEGAGMGILKRFDYGLNGTIGFQLDGGIISVNYGYGLAKLQSGANNDDRNNKHRVLSLTLGLKL